MTFYAEDVHRVWTKLPGVSVERLRTGIDVVMDESSRGLPTAPKADDPALPATAVGIQAVDVGYSSFKPQLEKSQVLFSGETSHDCAVCNKAVPSSGAVTLICPDAACNATTHIQCLSIRFLQTTNYKDAMVPTHGHCPSCGTKLQWVDLVKELTLRMRGEKEVKALFKPKRARKGTVAKSASVVDESSAEDDDPLDMVLDEEDDHFHELPESSDDEAPRIRSDPSPGHTAFKRPKPFTTFSEPVIDDSDPDEVELL